MVGPRTLAIDHALAKGPTAAPPVEEHHHMVQARRGPTQAKTQIPSTIIMMFTALLYRRETKARRGDGKYGR